MNNKKIIFPVLVAFCMGIIFCLSNQIGENSRNLSNNVSGIIIDVTAKILNKEIPKNRKKELIKEMRFIVRKSAHFFIFFILGVFVYTSLRTYNIKHPILYTLIICFIYACSDEIHQLFVNKRCGKIFDIFIDTCGAFIGTILCHYIFLFIKNKDVNPKIER